MLLDVKHLKMYFPVTSGVVFQRTVGQVKAVDDVSFAVRRGETLGLVGESGCGKTTTGRCILQLHRPTSGTVLFDGQDLCALDEREMRGMRRHMQVIFQDPYSSLNPRMTAGTIVGEPLRVQGLAPGQGAYRERVAELFSLVGLRASMIDRFPHEFSGGQRQRIGVARALAANPKFIVCDEPVSALDVSIQAQIVNLLEELQEKLDLTYLFIAHDLSVVRHISDRVAVMYLGHIMEIAERDAIYSQPASPLYRGTALRSADSRSRRGQSAQPHSARGRGTQPAEPANRMRVPSEVPQGHRGMSRGGAGVARGARWPLGVVHSCARLRRGVGGGEDSCEL